MARSSRAIKSAGVVLWRQFSEYCSRTALHGYQYMTEPGRPLLERFLWFVCHCCALTVASVMIFGTWRRYQESPTVTAVETTHFPLWKVPFPAITVCEPNQVTTTNAKRLALRLSEKDKDLEKEYLTSFLALREVIKHGTIPFVNVSRLHGALKKTGLDIGEIMRELSPNCNDYLDGCAWKGLQRPCSELFHRTKSDNGFCCSFNYQQPCLGRKCDSTGDKSPLAIPQYTTSVGNKFGLRVRFKYNNEERYMPVVPTDAIRVMVHNSFVLPSQWSAADIMVQRKRYFFVRVSAESSYSTDAVKKLPFSKSGCIHQDESDLDFENADNNANLYRRENCVVECRRQHILQLCGCQPYYYPAVEGVRLCDLSDLSCIHRHKVLLSRTKPPVEELAKGSTAWDGQDAMECNCPPQCNELTYRFETTSGTLYKDDYLDKLYGPADNISVFYFFFGKVYSTRYRRDLQLSWDTMLSNAGGLFGLFMGFSLISVFEFIYFFTVRLYFESNAQKKKSASRFKKWSARIFKNKAWQVKPKPLAQKEDEFGRMSLHPVRRSNFVY